MRAKLVGFCGFVGGGLSGVAVSAGLITGSPDPGLSADQLVYYQSQLAHLSIFIGAVTGVVIGALLSLFLDWYGDDAGDGWTPV